MSAKKDKFINYYRLLGVEENATLQEIRRAYRQKARELHPDKNPDNPKAEELFQAVKMAADILSDEKTRAEIDKELAARAAAAERHAAMDNRRAALKEVLEARERAAAAAAASSALHPKKYAEDIERLRKEGIARQREYADRLESRRLATVRSAAAKLTQSEEDQEVPSEGAFDLECAIRLRWSNEINARMGQQPGAVYGVEGRVLSDAQLERIFSLYGKVELVFSRKPRSASILFNSSAAAEAAKGVPPDGFKIAVYSDFSEAATGLESKVATPSPHVRGVTGTKRSAVDTEDVAAGDTSGGKVEVGTTGYVQKDNVDVPSGMSLDEGKQVPRDAVMKEDIRDDSRGTYLDSLWTSLSHEDHVLEVARKATAVSKLRQKVLQKAKLVASQ